MKCIYLLINQSSKVKKIKRRLIRLKRQKIRKVKMKKKDNCDCKNIQKLDKTIQLLYRRISNIQENHWHQVTSEIIQKKPETIVIFTDVPYKIYQNEWTKKKIRKERYYEFIRQLHYKCEIAGIEFIEVEK